MLAKSPLRATWVDESNRFARLVENGETIAIVDMSCGDWAYRLDQSVIPHRSKSSRTMRGGYASKIAAQIAAEDHVHEVRANDGSFARSDAAALGRDAIAVDPPPESDDEHLRTAFDVLGHRWFA